MDIIGRPRRLLGLLRVKVLLQANTQLFPQRLELLKVLIVLASVLDFGFDSCTSHISRVLFFPCLSCAHSIVITFRRSHVWCLGTEIYTFEDPHSSRIIIDPSRSL